VRKADLRSATLARCAIYTRKSSEDGLEQEFNSLDAQREACEAYITSQRHAGWVAVSDMYDDGGLSGGSMDRPALKRLLADIVDGKVQIIVVYKVDRLTRSLADFAKIVDVLDAHHASFVSVTQQFNTTTSMGRLTLNMLLSFAQFEREIAGERIRDKIAASKAKGMWMGGTVPLGYDVQERKLVVNATEAATVRLIFERYAQLGSVALLRAELDQRGVVSKRRHGAGGRLAGGQKFARGALYLMLQNHLYRGEIKHKVHVYEGQHEAIIDLDLWTIVQDRLEANRHDRSTGAGIGVPSLLCGLIVDAAGDRMTPTHAVKTGKRYRYYVSAALITGKRSEHARVQRIPAGDIEGLVLDRLRAFFAFDTEVSETLLSLELDASAQRAVLQRSAQLVQQWSTLPASELHELVRSIVAQVTVGESEISVELDRSGILTKLIPGAEPAETATAPSVLSIAARLRRSGKGTRLVIGDGAASKVDEGLASLIGRAVTTRHALLSGGYDSIDALAKEVGVRRDYLTVLVRLSYLAPEIVGAILAGQQPVDLMPTRLIARCKDLPQDWRAQRSYLGFGLD
jgi:site-specific DNA recombinase